ncbi:PfkB family carbohydrate kinase [Candidatus Merdisoma sp. JLR.KK006]|uniref:PfkB family carbohydrate kinase n=1 Tax=Candidatus Merdisoma sp. JLR.KK006 TaxID=3112626 RepID=UPI002FEFF1A4
MIYTVTLNPALDKTVEIPSLTVDSVNRITAMRTDPGGKGINVSKVIKKLGGESTATGILGGATGRAISSALEAMGIKTGFWFVEGTTMDKGIKG